jgi:signal transduction histidine kinase/ActR/RegA family two-component response regulator
MPRFTGLRIRLVGTVFLAIAPAWALLYLIARRTQTDLPWPAFAVGFLALAAAWFGGEHFILRQIRRLAKSAQLLREGDLTTRTGLAREKGEIGELARSFDSMAATLQQRVEEREQAEKTLLTRSFQQTVVSALGQFALVGQDFSAVLNQVVILVAQTLEVEYCDILELQPGGGFVLLRAGVGWQDGAVGKLTTPAGPESQVAFTMAAGEPVVVEDLRTDTRFRASSLLIDHGVVSGVSVTISGHGQPFGVLGAHTTHDRKFTEDDVHFLLAVGTVLAMAVERDRSEAQMQKLAEFARLNPKPAMELGANATIKYASEAATDLARSLGHEDPQDILPPDIGDIVRQCLDTRISALGLQTHLNGRTLEWSVHAVKANEIVHCYVEDITERLSLEAQLRQSQKMESVGQLAAGVAHDFNNMLSIIQGHAGMLLARRELSTGLRDSVQPIYYASERAATLTRQLLMFSRKNVMQPALIDLREIVTNVSKMLQRLLGETVTLKVEAPTEIPLVQADAGMVEQVIMNLAVNARDAMPKGGTLTISTGAREIDNSYVQTHPEARAGSFVCLRACDTGSGMDAATMARIFEPFFTTKEVGKGTGLGLATVYGIVKQHEGWIEVASEVGVGTVFSIFFPAKTAPVSAKPVEVAPVAMVQGGKETILVVEDERILRDMAHIILENCGYEVLEASTGNEALDVWNRRQGDINLLLTDMVMPEGLSGMELAQSLLANDPRLKIIFASGYSMDDLDTDFIREGHATFLQKPYTHMTLAKAVRDSLDK